MVNWWVASRKVCWSIWAWVRTIRRKTWIGCDEKIANLRVFEDENGKMNLSLLQVNGELLVISQFTLYGDCRRGRRPSFDEAAPPEMGEKFYELFIEKMRGQVRKVEKGIFGAHMEIESINDGPVTILLDSERRF